MVYEGSKLVAKILYYGEVSEVLLYVIVDILE